MYIFCEAENKHFIKNRYLHCNIMNVQYAFPKVAMWSVHFTPMIYKKKRSLERLRLTAVLNMIYFLRKNMYLWQTKALTEHISRKLNTVAKMYPQNLAVHLCWKLKSLQKILVSPHYFKNRSVTAVKFNFWPPRNSSLHSNLFFLVSKALCNIYKHNIVYIKYEM